MSAPNYDSQYTAMFDYLSTPTLPTEAESTVVFGRKDPLVARAVGDLIIPGLVETAVITGGIGKDSDDILALGFKSEAEFLTDALTKDAESRKYNLPPIMLDSKATNGGENARNSIAILESAGNPINSMAAVTHATSLRRLSETLKFEVAKKPGASPRIFSKPSDYAFNPANPADREEAGAELLRLADWPAKGMLGEQHDLPDNLVDFVRDTGQKSPHPVSPWQSALLRRMPKRMQQAAINVAARHGRK